MIERREERTLHGRPLSPAAAVGTVAEMAAHLFYLERHIVRHNSKRFSSWKALQPAAQDSRRVIPRRGPQRGREGSSALARACASPTGIVARRYGAPAARLVGAGILIATVNARAAPSVSRATQVDS